MRGSGRRCLYDAMGAAIGEKRAHAAVFVVDQ